MTVDPTAQARVLGIGVSFQDRRPNLASLLPQQVALIAQGNSLATYTEDPFPVVNAGAVGSKYGFGSPAHLGALMLLPVNGDGLGTVPLVLYPMLDNGSGVPADGSITVTGTATAAGSIQARIGGVVTLQIPVADLATANTVATAVHNAINAVLNMPVISVDGTGSADLTAKWDGPGGNDIVFEILGLVPGLVFGIVAPTSGANPPDIDTALAKITDKWESMVVNAIADETATLDKLEVWGEGRWGDLVSKPPVVFTGFVPATQAAFTVITDARKDDRTNSLIPVPGSATMPWLIAARAVARIARLANSDPARGFSTGKLDGVLPGLQEDQWTYLERDLAIKGGGSSTVLISGVPNLDNTVTCYHPDSEPIPAYRYVVDITKLQSYIYSHAVEFARDQWKDAPLVGDDDAVTNENARKPKHVKSAIGKILDGLGLAAVIVNVAAAKESLVVLVDVGNPKRLNITESVELSGNTFILSFDLGFGFNFGGVSLAA